MNTLQFRSMEAGDWDAVAAIYKQGIDTRNATFQEDIPAWEDWDKAHLKTCRFVAISGNEIAAWAALSPVSGRCVYAGVAEVSVYVGEKFRGQKIGMRLLEKIISASEKENLWTLQAGIFPENKASLHIHTTSGFRIIGYRERIGKMKDTWRDTVLLERRSKIVGVE
ncbi:MAG: N-acetyltransferase family protein [Chitinophagaceae bacterium]